jgi:hypothetical protein
MVKSFMKLFDEWQERQWRHTVDIKEEILDEWKFRNVSGHLKDLRPYLRRHDIKHDDIQHNDIHHNDTQHNGLNYDTNHQQYSA